MGRYICTGRNDRRKPNTFGLGDTPSINDLRIFELGAGTGLFGLTVAKMLAVLGNRQTTVVSIDFHLSILANLKANIDANFPVKNDGDTIPSSAIFSTTQVAMVQVS